MAKLTDRERQFINLYLGQCHMNGAKAARMMKYADPKNEAYRILQRPQVKAAIDQRLRAGSLSADEVIFRLGQHARGHLRPFLYNDYDGEDNELTPRGTIKLDTDDAYDNAHLLKECTTVTETIGEAVLKTTVKVKLHDPQAALDKLARVHGLYKDQLNDLLKSVDMSRLTVGQLQRITAGEPILNVLLTPEQNPDDAPALDDTLPAEPLDDATQSEDED